MVGSIGIGIGAIGVTSGVGGSVGVGICAVVVASVADGLIVQLGKVSLLDEVDIQSVGLEERGSSTTERDGLGSGMGSVVEISL